VYNAKQKEMQKILAERLKMLRESKGLSYEKLVEELKRECNVGISKQSLIDYEKGIFDEFHKKQNAGLGMNIAYLAAFAKYFNVSTDYLLGLTPHATPIMELRVICELLGLSADAVSGVLEIKKLSEIAVEFNSPPPQKALELFLCEHTTSGDVIKILMQISEHMEIASKIKQLEIADACYVEENNENFIKTASTINIPSDYSYDKDKARNIITELKFLELLPHHKEINRLKERQYVLLFCIQKSFVAWVERISTLEQK